MTDDRPPQPEGFPPGTGPTGAAAAEPPPLTAFAWRNGLVRPSQGRLLAGVSGALARATNTDPVLWRVIIAVLTIFGGLGVLLYLLGWLLLPADGDTASPVEALLGRGRSATSGTLTVILGVVALISVGAFVSEPFQPGVVGAVLLGAAALLLLRDQRGRNRSTPTAPAPMAAPMAAGVGTPGPPADTTASTAEYPGAPYAGAPYPGAPYPGAPYPAAAYPGAASAPATAAPAGRPTVASSTAAATPLAPQPPYPQNPYAAPQYTPPQYTPPQYSPPQYTPSQYGQPPFAPRGPFAQGGLPPQPPRPPRVTTPRAPKPPRSRLGRLTFSLLLIMMGVLIVIDLNVHRIPAIGYLATALGVVAVGLIIGTWFGRARGLIAVGIVLAIALTSVTGLSRFNNGPFRSGTTTYTPVSVSQLQREYVHDFGEVRLDLTKVNFAAEPQTVNIDIIVQGGTVRVTLPSNVDVTVDSHVDVGEARVLGQTWNGFGLDARTVTDDGPDGKGGGTLHITARVNAGDLEVTR